jgi:predicted enzyme related to lactoylglutathione lyase
MHDVCHVEFVTRDMPRLVEFYREIFGWKKVQDTPTYITLAPKEGPAIGFAAVGEGVPAPMIINYIFVKNIEAALELVRAHGLDVILDKTEVPNMGWFAHFKDPEGNVVGLWTTARRAAPQREEKPATKAARANGGRARARAKKKVAKKARARR